MFYDHDSATIVFKLDFIRNFNAFPSIFNVFMNIHEYVNSIICIYYNGMKGLCLSFNLVPSLNV